MARQKNTPKIIGEVENAARALDLRKAGATYAKIGEALGVSTQRAHQIVVDSLQKTLREPAGELRTLELERIDRMLMGVWVRAAGTDAVPASLNAQAAVLRLMERRAKLLGLDAPAKLNHAGVIGTYDLEELSKLPLDDLRKLKDILGPAAVAGLDQSGDSEEGSGT